MLLVVKVILQLTVVQTLVQHLVALVVLVV
jgi:hypothetical protein